jgi:predicted peptidase
MSNSLSGQESKPRSREELVASLAGLYESKQFHSKNRGTLQYRLLPPVLSEPNKRLPLLVFLHGAGERGSDNLKQLVHGAKDFAIPERRRKYPCYVVAPQCPDQQKWSDVDWTLDSSSLPLEPSDSMACLKELIDELIQNGSVDSDRVYITGLSMGGYGTWDAIARYPNLFAAAAPICGGGDPTKVDRFSKLPIWCFHGELDRVVKPIRSREMVEALRKIGSTVKYTEYPKVDHDSWTATYSNSQLYEWLFAQQKNTSIAN